MTVSRSETYVVSNIGTCLLLKLCGFVHEQRAEIRDISENHMRLRIGSSWLAQLLGSGHPGYPLDVEMQFAPLEETQRSSHPQAKVDIVVRDRRSFFQPDRFETATKRLFWQLRGHLMVH